MDPVYPDLTFCDTCGRRTYKKAEFCKDHSPIRRQQHKDAQKRYRQTEKGKAADKRVYQRQRERLQQQLIVAVPPVAPE